MRAIPDYKKRPGELNAANRAGTKDLACCDKPCEYYAFYPLEFRIAWLASAWDGGLFFFPRNIKVRFEMRSSSISDYEVMMAQRKSFHFLSIVCSAVTNNYI